LFRILYVIELTTNLKRTTLCDDLLFFPVYIVFAIRSNFDVVRAGKWFLFNMRS